jgi:hypothetical protein
VVQGEIHLLCPCWTDPHEGDIPLTGFRAVEQGWNVLVQHGLKRHTRAPSQDLPEVKSDPLHFTRGSIPDDV